jgi:hypothetical protein
VTETLDAPGSTPSRPAGHQTVREATFDVFRRLGLTTMFANPGSTEVPFLTDLPGDLRFVLGLHENAVVSMAAGFAIGRGEPALVILHTAAGLGNAVAALATARVNRAIADLPERQKLAVTLVHLEGLSNIAAAAVMDVSVEAIESLLGRGRRALRESLAEDWRGLLDELSSKVG